VPRIIQLAGPEEGIDGAILIVAISGAIEN